MVVSFVVQAVVGVVVESLHDPVVERRAHFVGCQQQPPFALCVRAMKRDGDLGSDGHVRMAMGEGAVAPETRCRPFPQNGGC